jgi:hypothetical protein
LRTAGEQPPGYLVEVGAILGAGLLQFVPQDFAR